MIIILETIIHITIPMKNESAIKRAIRILGRKNTIFRTCDALKIGIHPRVLYKMRYVGKIHQLSRGLYWLKGNSTLSNPDFVQVAIKIPKSVICLISALSFHGLTTQIPHEVSIALRKNDYYPKHEYPPVRVFWFSDKSFAAGIEIHTTDGVDFRIYSPEKTIADCFKYRNKIGIDVAIEALKLYKERKKVRLGDLLRFAQIDRVENIIQPYLAAVL